VTCARRILPGSDPRLRFDDRNANGKDDQEPRLENATVLLEMYDDDQEADFRGTPRPML
jgi:hypothetical protein